jgi:hypothetical protein
MDAKSCITLGTGKKEDAPKLLNGALAAKLTPDLAGYARPGNPY